MNKYDGKVNKTDVRVKEKNTVTLERMFLQQQQQQQEMSAFVFAIEEERRYMAWRDDF